MASLFPLIQDLLPMILPSSVHVAKGSDLLALPNPAATQAPEPTEEIGQGVVRKDAIVDKTDKMCASGEPIPRRFYPP